MQTFLFKIFVLSLQITTINCMILAGKKGEMISFFPCNLCINFHLYPKDNDNQDLNYYGSVVPFV